MTKTLDDVIEMDYPRKVHFSDYDSAGRVIHTQQGMILPVWGQKQETFSVGYAWNLSGGLESLTYPGGRTATFDLDVENHPVAVGDGTRPGCYAQDLTWSLEGDVENVFVPWTDNTRLRYHRTHDPVTRRITEIGLDGRMSLTYAWKKDGNVASITHGEGDLGKESFTYDALDRLVLAEYGSLGTIGYGYDRYGNMLSRAVTLPASRCTDTPFDYSSDAADLTSRNRLPRSAGFGYDPRGNLLAWKEGTLTTNLEWDQQGRLVAVTPRTGPESYSHPSFYGYDDEGRRLSKDTDYNQDHTFYIYGAGAEPVSEVRIFRGMKKLASSGEAKKAAGAGRSPADGPPMADGAQTEEGPEAVKYAFTDHLGTPRYTLGGTFNPVQFSEQYTIRDVQAAENPTPFGGLILDSTGEAPMKVLGDPLFFTGKLRDTESGLDYFGARYYSSRFCRWTSPDQPFLDNHIEEPQSWNLYTYVQNNPVRFFDPTGQAIELLGSDDMKRKNELSMIQQSVGNSEAASRLYINEVKEGDKVRYFVGIQGNVGEFMKLSETAHDLANLVANKNVVEYGLTSRNLKKFGGAATFRINEDTENPNQNVRVLVNPEQVRTEGGRRLCLVLQGKMKFKGQDQPPLWNIRWLTPQVATWHEFGHAWGHIHGRVDAASNQDAIDWENHSRKTFWGALGSNNAPRRWE